MIRVEDGSDVSLRRRLRPPPLACFSSWSTTSQSSTTSSALTSKLRPATTRLRSWSTSMNCPQLFTFGTPARLWDFRAIRPARRAARRACASRRLASTHMIDSISKRLQAVRGQTSAAKPALPLRSQSERIEVRRMVSYVSSRNRDDHDSEDGEEEVGLEERLSQAPFGTRLDDGPHVWPPSCSASIHHASRERTPARMLRSPRWRRRPLYSICSSAATAMPGGSTSHRPRGSPNFFGGEWTSGERSFLWRHPTSRAGTA